MKIGIQTWGSNGDIRPLLALADGLQKQGNQVTFVVSSIDNQSYQPICEQLGLAYRQVPEVLDFDMQGFAQRSFKMQPLQWLRALLDEAFFLYEADIYAAAQQLVAENDYVIGHHFLYPLKLAALQQHKPFISVMFCHAAVPNPAVPPLRFPDLGTYINKLSWALLDRVFNWTLKKPLTRLWLEAGAPPPKHILSELLTSQQLNLVAVDPLFCRHAVRELQWQATQPNIETTALLRARTLAEAAKSLLGTKNVSVSLAPTASHDRLAGFSGDSKSMTSRMLDGTFPPYKHLLPQDVTTTVVVEVATFLDSVRRVALVTDKTVPLRLTFSGTSLELEAGAGEEAQATEAIEILLTGEPITIAFNPTFLIDGLQAIGTQFVQISFTGSNKPAILTGKEKQDGESIDNYKYLLMPMRYAS